LHKAEIKGSSRIRTDSDLPIVQYSPDGTGLIINRQKFHRKLVCVFEDYLDDLRNPVNQSRRESLRKKLDAICHYPYYFAYGSNMVSKRMQDRIPEASIVGIAGLPDWNLTWDKTSKDGSGKANLKEQKKGKVWGIVYRIPDQKISDLDKIEGGYQRMEMEIQFSNQDKRLVFTYVSENRDANLEPYQWYKDLVVKGAEEHSLPKDYVDQIKQVSAKPDTRDAAGEKA
jgi:gamma-glutamylcyclotransferase